MQLLVWVLNHFDAGILNQLLVREGHGAHLVSGKLPFKGDSQPLFGFVNNGIEVITLQAESHAVALQKAAVIIPGKPGIARLFGNALGNVFIVAHIQQCIHHTGLRYGRPAAHG